MVECTALEMRHTRKGIEGSNPSLSAKDLPHHPASCTENLSSEAEKGRSGPHTWIK